MEGFTQDVPLIIGTAAKSPLGILSLSITAISIIAFYFFKDDGWKIKLPVFLILFMGVSAIGYAVIQNIPENSNNVSIKKETEKSVVSATTPTAEKVPNDKSTPLEPIPKPTKISKSVEDKLQDRWIFRFGTKWEE